MLVLEFGSCVKEEVAVLGSPVLNSPYGLRERKATLDSTKPKLGEKVTQR